MELNIRRILVPTDFGTLSEHVVQYATGLAANFGAAIRVLGVVDSLVSPEAGWTGPAIEAAALHHRLYDEPQAKITAIAAAVEKAGVRAIGEVRSGAPSAQIIRAAIDWGADLIVMATHGQLGLTPLVIGRVADHVVRHAPCPVLVVRDAAPLHPQDTGSQQENVA